MIKRPEGLQTTTVRMRTGCGKIYITVTNPTEEYKEIFGTLGKTGGCAACQTACITRLATLAWNYGAPVEKIVKQLDGHLCPHSGGLDLSCPQAIADVLRNTQTLTTVLDCSEVALDVLERKAETHFHDAQKFEDLRQQIASLTERLEAWRKLRSYTKNNLSINSLLPREIEALKVLGEI